MYMTSMRDRSPEDVARAGDIVTKLREKSKIYDHHVAPNEGFRIFIPNVPQPEYHLTSYKNGSAPCEARFTGDPTRPTSLLYEKSQRATIWSARCTRCRSARRKIQLGNERRAAERFDVGICKPHQICVCRRAVMTAECRLDEVWFARNDRVERFCDAAGGRFSPVIFGWMVHVYPYEDSLDKIFAMHMHKD